MPTYWIRQAQHTHASKKHVHCRREKRKNKKKRAKHVRHTSPIAEYPHHIWTMDFMHDRLRGGRKIRILNILDIFSRKCVGSYVDFGINSEKVVDYLKSKKRYYAIPKYIRVDNGSEFTSKNLDQWAYENQVEISFIEPGKPTQNGFIESFNGRMRDECLRCSHFISLTDAREVVEKWRKDYNKFRPNSSLNNDAPNTFLERYFKENEVKIKPKLTFKIV